MIRCGLRGNFLSKKHLSRSGAKPLAIRTETALKIYAVTSLHLFQLPWVSTSQSIICASSSTRFFL